MDTAHIGGSSSEPVKAARSRGHQAEDPHQQAGGVTGHSPKQAGDPEYPGGEQSGEEKNKGKSAEDRHTQAVTERPVVQDQVQGQERLLSQAQAEHHQEDVHTQAVTGRLEELWDGGGQVVAEMRAELAKDAGGSPHGPVKAARSRGHPAEDPHKQAGDPEHPQGEKTEKDAGGGPHGPGNAARCRGHPEGDPHRQAGEEWGHSHMLAGDPEHPQGENTGNKKDKARSAKDMAIQETDERLQELLHKGTRHPSRLPRR